MSETLVIALGGNAIKQAEQVGTFEEQIANVDVAAAQIAGIIETGCRVIVTHGNGPQVGSLLIQQEAGKALVPEQPLFACGAMTQGTIGWMLQNRISHHARARGLDTSVVSVVTQVVVDGADQDFQNPTKPVGPFYTKEEADVLRKESGYILGEMKPNAERGWRRLVASPQPIDIVEKKAIRALIDSGVVVIASGGGGIPVYTDKNNDYLGIDAVIDKDRSAVLLAELIDADHLMILTDVPNVLLNYGTPHEQKLEKVSLDEMRKYIADGHFQAGSMGPKVEGAVRFAENTGKTATITSLDCALDGLRFAQGTHITGI